MTSPCACKFCERQYADPLQAERCPCQDSSASSSWSQMRQWAGWEAALDQAQEALDCEEV